MYSLTSVTFALFFTLGYSEIPEFSLDDTQIKINEWLVRIAEGIDVATKIAQKEGFEIVDEIPELKLFKFSNLNPNEKITKEEIFDKLSKYEEISWKSPITIATIHPSNFPFRGFPIFDGGLITRLIDDPHPLEYDEDDFPKIIFGSPIYSRSGDDSELPSIHEDRELQKYPSLYCAGPENIVIKSNKPQFCNDPLYPQQWFYRSCKELMEPEPAYYDIKLVQTWQDFNVYGRGIKVLVFDDGVKMNHEDLVVDPEYSYNPFNPTNRNDPSPANPDESHGTACAGVIGMKKDNGICGVGIAPEATIGGVKMQLNNQSPSDSLSKALLFKQNEIDIVSMSVFSTKILLPLERSTESALIEGATNGRGGKGILYFVSAGNQKEENNPVQCSRLGILNSIYVITIGGVNHDGSTSTYANRCSNVMAVLYSGDGYPFSIPTIDLGRSNVECNPKFNGTSASTPMAAGAIALVLEANPDLSWRDVHYIIAWTGEVAPLSKNPGWTKNAAGFYVNLDFGFGLMNIYEMVSLAKNFKKATPPMHGCVVSAPSARNKQIAANSPIKIELPTKGCEEQPWEINYVEHVLLTVALDYDLRGDLQIVLTSPKGTKVNILEPRPYDYISSSIYDFNFHSVHTWGENPKGTWIVEIFDKSNKIRNRGQLYRIELTIYGAKDQPELYKKGERKYLPFKFK